MQTTSKDTTLISHPSTQEKTTLLENPDKETLSKLSFGSHFILNGVEMKKSIWGVAVPITNGYTGPMKLADGRVIP